jgi:hypothetical protein
MKKFLLLNIIFLGLALMNHSQAQTQEVSSTDITESSNTYDVRLLKYYTPAELDEIKEADSSSYKSIIYYHLSSYRIDIYDENNAVQHLFPIANFDILLYENFRQLHEDYIIDFDKYGLKLVIFSYDKLKKLLPIQVTRIEQLKANK